MPTPRRAPRDIGLCLLVPQVRALLDGEKLQHRIPLDPQPGDHYRDGWYPDRYDRGSHWCMWGAAGTPQVNKMGMDLKVPFEIGDRAWVKEPFGFVPQPSPAAATMFDDHRSTVGAAGMIGPDRISGITWKAHWNDGSQDYKWRSPAVMPKWASRLTLLVTDIRIERLHAMGEEEAVAEGTREPSWRSMGGALAQAAMSEAQVFRRIWDFQYGNGPAAWNENPWVMRLDFEVHHRNVELAKAAGLNNAAAAQAA